MTLRATNRGTMALTVSICQSADNERDLNSHHLLRLVMSFLPSYLTFTFEVPEIHHLLRVATRLRDCGQHKDQQLRDKQTSPLESLKAPLPPPQSSPKEVLLSSMHPIVPTLPAVILSAEFILGGVGRVSPFPFARLHERIYLKSKQTAPVLYPPVPFRDVQGHLKWVGTWMIGTGLLIAHPQTWGKLSTLALVLFWTGAGWYSQAKTGMPYWLPICNALLGTFVWYSSSRS